MGWQSPRRTTQASTTQSSNDLPPFGKGQGPDACTGEWGFNLHQVSPNTCSTGVGVTHALGPSWAGDVGCELFLKLCMTLQTLRFPSWREAPHDWRAEVGSGVLGHQLAYLYLGTLAVRGWGDTLCPPAQAGLTVVEGDSMQAVQQLPLVFMDSLDLNIKHG